MQQRRIYGNVPEARGYGAEISGAYDFGNGFRVSGGLGLLDTEITDAGPNAVGLQGEELPGTANVTANLGLAYMSETGFDASALLRHVGSRIDAADVGSELPSYTALDLAAGYEFDIGEGRTFRIDGFVENVTDERIVTSTISFFDLERVGRPRTIGIAGTVRF